MDLEAKAKKLSWKDIALVKMSAVLIGISIGSYFTSYF